MVIKYDAPAGLSEKSKLIWQGVVPRRAKSAGRIILIKTALQALDRVEEISMAIKEQGLTIENPSTGLIRANPLIKIEKELRRQFTQIWVNLSLEWDSVIDGGNDPFYRNSVEEREGKEQIQNNEIVVRSILSDNKQELNK